MKSSFQPFLISEFKTGLFNYLQPWIRTADAFGELSNAYIYRGTLNKREGYQIFGNMAYRDNNSALGNGGMVYSGTIPVHPIHAGTSFFPFTITAVGSPDQVISDSTGSGVLSGDGTGTINYTTGAWTATFTSNVSANNNIYIDYQPNTSRPIMGLKTWSSEVDGSRDFIAFDTRRAAVYNTGTQEFDPISSISQVIFIGDGSANTTGAISTGWESVTPYTNALAPFSITVTQGSDTAVDDGAGSITSSGNISGGSVNYATGVITVTFTAAPSAGENIVMTALLAGDYFTGNFSNFFNATNWIAASYISPNPGWLYCTNNIDPITIYDGVNLSRPPFPITLAHQSSFTNDIAACLDIDVYKNRLTVQLPTLTSSATPEAQSIRWSAINQPTNLVADVTGNGGEKSAPTDDFIESSEFLRDQLIVFFANSTWSFRWRGSDFDPFEWYKINNTKSTTAPYATIPYDERITAMGNKGLIACDGVNVQRYDLPIIENFTQINPGTFDQCFGIRFDTSNQSWMLYPSQGSTLSNRSFIYNFLENTWAIYNIEMSCLGLFSIPLTKTWNDFSPTSQTPLTWDQADFPWDSYTIEGLAANLFGGSLSGGYVYQMGIGEADHPTSNSTPVAISTNILSAKWNPFSSIGEKVQFGYIDVYYEVNNDCTLVINFYVDNGENISTTRNFTLEGPENQNFQMKRIYINVVGQFLQMEIINQQSQGFKILGFVLWASQSGRLTPGYSVT